MNKNTGGAFGISFRRNVVFITRVSRMNKIEQLNKNICEVLDGSNFEWKQFLLFDLTKVGQVDWSIVKRMKNVVPFTIKEKPEHDPYMNFAIDYAAKAIVEKDIWIYILDDDNMLLPEFKDLAWDLDADYPITVFNIKMPALSNGFNGTVKIPLEYGKTLFHIDSANYIVQRKVFDVIRHANNIKSKWHDGIFMQKALKCQIPIKYINKVYGQHNEGV